MSTKHIFNFKIKNKIKQLQIQTGFKHANIKFQSDANQTIDQFQSKLEIKL